jgi:hypothetical protein
MSKILLSVEAEDWDLLCETLFMDSQSGAFDRKLRDDIIKALDAVEEVTPLVLVEVFGGVADVTYCEEEAINAHVIDWDCLEDGANQCPYCLDIDTGEFDLKGMEKCPKCGFPFENEDDVIAFLQKETK